MARLSKEQREKFKSKRTHPLDLARRQNGSAYSPVMNPDNWRGELRVFTSRGNIRKSSARGWVYIGTAGPGKVKIGISAEPAKRCRSLGLKLYAAIEAMPMAVQKVETEALRLLGAIQGSTEYLYMHDPEEAVSVVRKALQVVGRYCHADPSLTAEQALALRKALVE